MKPGLYYPYIKIRNVDWLKGTLLVLPRVYRLVPGDFSPWDDPATKEFSQPQKGAPLLLPADLGTSSVREAELTLRSRLERDAEEVSFLARYGCEPTRAKLSRDDLGVQLHRHKFDERFIGLLLDKGLAWPPIKYEPTDPEGTDYVEVNDRLGEAIMSTIAIAAADYHGADVVAEPRSERLHACLVEKRISDVYDAWLHPSYPDRPRQQTGETLFEFFVEWACDLGGLNPQRIAGLQDERAAAEELIGELDRLGGHLRIGDPDALEREMKGVIRQVLDEWKGERTQGLRFRAELLGKGVAAPGVEFAKKLVEKAASPGAGGAAAGLATGKILGGLAVGGLVGAAAGLAVGVITHGVGSYARAREKGKSSPRRFLTTLTDAGVSIRIPPDPAPETDDGGAGSLPSDEGPDAA